MTYITNKDFFLEVSKGNVSGHSGHVFFSVDKFIGITEKTVGGIPGRYSFQASAVAMEIISTSVNDAAAGTGVRTVLVEGLNASYVEQSETVTMNGTTNVNLVNTYLRINNITAKTAGSGGINDGDITVQLDAGGVAQSVIMTGANRSQDGVYTVPAGKTGHLLFINAISEKNEDIVARVLRRALGELFIEGAQVPLYQNVYNRDLIIPIPITEKTDIEIVARSSNVDASLTFIQQLILIDN